MSERSVTLRNRHRAIIAQAQPPCALCGQSIDYSIPSIEPDGFVVDHIIPLEAGGTDTIENKQAAHRRCNRAKGAKADGGPVLRRSSSLSR